MNNHEEINKLRNEHKNLSKQCGEILSAIKIEHNTVIISNEILQKSTQIMEQMQEIRRRIDELKNSSPNTHTKK